MCGICFSLRPLPVDQSLADLSISSSSNSNAISSSSKSTLDHWNTLVDAVKTRGPDYQHSVTREVNIEGQKWELKFHACILSMRGENVTQQPFISPQGDIFLWNGEIFGGIQVNQNQNDGEILFQEILRGGPDGLLDSLQRIRGPYTFVFYQDSTNRVYFGRDVLGRRSLLLHKPTTDSATYFLTSNGTAVDYELNEFSEVPSEAIHYFDLNSQTLETFHDDSKPHFQSLPRLNRSDDAAPTNMMYPFSRLLSSIPTQIDLLPLDDPSQLPIATDELQSTMDNLIHHLSNSVRARVTNLPTFPLPPQARIAVLFSGGIDCTTLALLADMNLPENESVDLINVAFENPRVLRGNTAPINEKKRAKKLAKGKENGIVEENPLEEKIILGIYDVPDRLTGYASYEELKRLKPNRQWKFVEVNVTYAEMLEERDKVLELMRPTRTVMDLSIAIAFYFAARGKGSLSPALGAKSTPYTSTARVLLSGLGADELLGGYARHRKAYIHNRETPWKSLIEELQLDIDRISNRNLGRDDRIISHHGKEARYPFLDENVVDFCVQIKVWLKCDPRFIEGVGDKLLLRKVAIQLGLEGAAGLKKRAIHFGARTAKMELDSGKIKGQLEVSAAQYPLQKDSSITNSSSHLSNYFGQQPKAILFSLTSLMIGIIRESLPSITRMMEVAMVYENLLTLPLPGTLNEKDSISWPLTSSLEYWWKLKMNGERFSRGEQLKELGDQSALEKDYKTCLYYYEIVIVMVGATDQKIKLQALTNSAAIRLRLASKDSRHLTIAIFETTMALEIDSNYVKALFRRGLALALLKKWNQAIIDFERAVELDPNSPAKKELEVARRQVVRRIGN